MTLFSNHLQEILLSEITLINDLKCINEPIGQINESLSKAKAMQT